MVFPVLRRLLSATASLALSLILFCILPAVSLAAPAMESDSQAPPGLQGLPNVGVSQGFLINGRPIRVEAFTSALKGRHPAVIMLYGAGGRSSAGLLMPATHMLQRMGISAYIIHYANGIGGDDWAAPKLSEMRDQVLSEVVTYVAHLSDTDPERIGVFGLSTGAFTALERASRDPRIKVVVDMVGALPYSVDRATVSRMPPVLILHGGNDDTVPVGRAFDLADFMQQLGAEAEFHFYPDQGHSFRGEALADASRHATGFLMRHLLPRAELAAGMQQPGKAPATVSFVRHQAPDGQAVGGTVQQARLP